jgi:hypothetical protein
MTSRTPEGKHTKRFIVEYKSPFSGKWGLSFNGGHEGFFKTREEANAALTPKSTSDGYKYRIRQK